MTSPKRVTSLGRIAELGTLQLGAKNQPNNFREEDCVHALGVEHKYEWNDVKCSDCHRFTCKKGKLIIPLNPNISMHILHTALHTFHMVMTRRIAKQSIPLVLVDHFLFFSHPLCLIEQCYYKEKLKGHCHGDFGNFWSKLS